MRTPCDPAATSSSRVPKRGKPLILRRIVPGGIFANRKLPSSSSGITLASRNSRASAFRHGNERRRRRSRRGRVRGRREQLDPRAFAGAGAERDLARDFERARCFDDLRGLRLRLVFLAWLGGRPQEPDRDHSNDEYESDGIFRLRPAYDGECNACTVANAIARMALSERQRELPQWGYFSGDGVVKTRHYEGRSLRRARFDPQFLLMINYADSGPGFSWPETYHAVLFPHYDVYIVTASQDSPEVHGYVDEAMGFFPKDKDIIEGAKPLMCKWWPGEIEP